MNGQLDSQVEGTVASVVRGINFCAEVDESADTLFPTSPDGGVERSVAGTLDFVHRVSSLDSGDDRCMISNQSILSTFGSYLDF